MLRFMSDAFHRNVPGPFYVQADCCITCGVPVELAPEMFMWENPDAPHPSCFVYRQPETLTELVKMVDVMGQTEMDCIRFRGDYPEMRHLLIENGHAQQCDPEK